MAVFLRHCSEDRVVAADGGAVLIVLGLGVAHVVKLRLKHNNTCHGENAKSGACFAPLSHLSTLLREMSARKPLVKEEIFVNEKQNKLQSLVGPRAQLCVEQ